MCSIHTNRNLFVSFFSFGCCQSVGYFIWVCCYFLFDTSRHFISLLYQANFLFLGFLFICSPSPFFFCSPWFACPSTSSFRALSLSRVETGFHKVLRSLYQVGRDSETKKSSKRTFHEPGPSSETSRAAHPRLSVKEISISNKPVEVNMVVSGASTQASAKSIFLLRSWPCLRQPKQNPFRTSRTCSRTSFSPHYIALIFSDIFSILTTYLTHYSNNLPSPGFAHYSASSVQYFPGVYPGRICPIQQPTIFPFPFLVPNSFQPFMPCSITHDGHVMSSQLTHVHALIYKPNNLETSTNILADKEVTMK